MNKKVVVTICIMVFIVIIGGAIWIKLYPTFDKSNPIIFKEQSNDNYASIIYDGREYVPYCPYNPKEREKYLGYVGNDKNNEIYTVTKYSEKEWLINYIDSGMMNDCMLLKEKNVTNIPEGISSEYEWNN